MSRARDAHNQNIIKRRRHECRGLSQVLESPFSGKFSGAKDGAFLSSLRDWFRGLPVNPPLETVGYDRSSIRDFSSGDTGTSAAGTISIVPERDETPEYPEWV